MYLVAQSHLTLCDPMDCSLPGSSVHGILQVRILEWVAVSLLQELELLHNLLFHFNTEKIKVPRDKLICSRLCS